MKIEVQVKNSNTKVVGTFFQVPLKTRFLSLWRRCCSTGEGRDSESVWDALLSRYTQTHRHYHGLGHIKHCLEQHDLAASEMEDQDAVEMAIWFHDAIYTPRAQDNERQSAALFHEMASCGMASSFIDKVCSLIMATTHKEVLKRRDEQFIVDIDLSSFGLPWDLYMRDTKAIRAEQPDISDENYYSASRRFIAQLTDRHRIFNTDFFFDKYERFARKNINRYMEQIAAPGSKAPASGITDLRLLTPANDNALPLWHAAT